MVEKTEHYYMIVTMALRRLRQPVQVGKRGWRAKEEGTRQQLGRGLRQWCHTGNNTTTTTTTSSNTFPARAPWGYTTKGGGTGCAGGLASHTSHAALDTTATGASSQTTRTDEAKMGGAEGVGSQQEEVQTKEKDGIRAAREKIPEWGTTAATHKGGWATGTERRP